MSGNPVENARIDHMDRMVVVSLLVDPFPNEVRTDAHGQFRVTTSAPAIVVRKPGYVSARVSINHGAQEEIVLQRFTSYARCKQSASPKVKTKKTGDVDFTATWFYIQTKNGPKGILNGSGPSYSSGAPDSQAVWNSKEYAEVMYENGVIDASGHTSDGKYWRSRSRFGAVAQYYNVNRETADLFDCVMDVVTLR